MSISPRRGRRPGKQDTREVILEAARNGFAESGYDGISVRQIAAAAGVDGALVHHYFGTKEQLFLAAVQFPIDPAGLIDGITDGPIESLGHRLADTFLSTWEHPTSGPALEALLRGALTSRVSGRLVQEFFAVQVIRRVMHQVSGIVEPDQIPTRAGLVASQLFGLAVVRHMLRFEPLASTPRRTIVAAVAPTLQRYFTGTIDGNEVVSLEGSNEGDLRDD